MAFADFIRAADGTRLFEGRLTGGFVHGPTPTPHTSVHVAPALLSAALGVTAVYPPDAHRALVARLFFGDTPDGLRRLTRLLADSPQPAAGVASDLSALHLSRAIEEDSALEAARALDCAQLALSSAPQLPEALFNRALALEHLQFHEAARRAWDSYLAVDSTSAWAQEARVRSARLAEGTSHRLTREVRTRLAQAIDAGDWPQVESLVRDVPQAAREHLDETLLPDWAEAIQHHDGDRAQRRLQQAQRVADALLARYGEHAWHVLTETLAVADAGTRDTLASGLLDLKNGRLLIDNDHPEQAWTPLVRARRALAQVPPLAAAADFWIANARWYRRQPPSSGTRSTGPAVRELVAADLASLADRCARDGFVYLQGRALLLRASTLNSLTRYTDAQAASRLASQLFDRLGEYEYAASTRAPLGNHLAFQGDLLAAWQEQRAAFANVRDMESLRRRVVVLGHGVILATRFGLPHAAIVLHEAQMEAVRHWNNPSGLVRELLERARLRLDLDDRAGARRDIEAATQVVERMTDSSFRAQFEDDVSIERARLIEIENPKHAAQILETAISNLSHNGRVFQLTELYLEGGRVLSRAGDQTAALNDWLQGLDRFEDQRLEVRDEQLRISHFARSWDLYAEAVALLVARGDTDRALSLVERSHARALLDSILPTEHLPVLHPRDAIPALPPGVLVLVYQSLPRELLVWSLTHTGVALDRVPVAASEILRLTTRLRDEEQTVLAPDLLARLSEVLLGPPLASRLEAARSLVIVPDVAIAGVPFAALTARRGGTPLASRLPITYAPGLSLLSMATRRLAEPAVAPLRAWFFADPVLGAGRDTLPRLRLAQLEIQQSASVYPGAQKFSERDATETRLLEALGTVDVLHFAGHAIANAEYPSRSRLLAAAGEGTDDGDVLPQEIAGRRPACTRLVVLSACSTAAGSPAFGEGVLSLARPFLSAGVPQVIGTLWDIDDRAGLALMPRFHRWYAQGVGAAEALRRAQEELRQSADPLERDPRTWSAFVLVGGLDTVPVP